MAIPPTAVQFSTPLDPSEELDYLVPLTPILEIGEAAETYSLVLLPEAVALGLTIMNGDDRDHKLVQANAAISFWLTIDPALRGDLLFEGGGTALPMEVTITTSSEPPRIRQRTFLVPVVQQ
jgi:hypothetical protein